MIIGPLRFPSIAIKSCDPDQAWQYAVHAVIQDVERRQFVGKQATSYTISLALHAEFGLNPRAVLDQLKELGDDHEVLTLQELDGTVLGNYIVESAPAKTVWKLPDGTIVYATCELKLVDPGLDADLLPPQAAVAVTSTDLPTTKDDRVEDRTRAPNDYTPREIARL